MTTVDHATGEIIEFDRAAAERRAERIRLRLDAIADNYSAVMPMIRDAIEKRDDLALGYRSPGDYVRDRFGGALQRLDLTVRRAVVHELTEAGLSTRAIAPVVGVSNFTVQKDREAGVRDLTPASETSRSLSSPGKAMEGAQRILEEGAAVSIGTARQPGDGEGLINASGESRWEAGTSLTSRPAVTGVDGKIYAKRSKPVAPTQRQSDVDRAAEYVGNIARSLASLLQITHENRRSELIESRRISEGRVSPAQLDQLTPETMRAVADGLHDLADEWEESNV